jgi:serine/threonine protein kinase
MLLSEQDDVMLSDFGLAIASQSSYAPNARDVVGTVSYMAPEQLQGRPSSSTLPPFPVGPALRAKSAYRGMTDGLRRKRPCLPTGMCRIAETPSLRDARRSYARCARHTHPLTLLTCLLFKR